MHSPTKNLRRAVPSEHCYPHFSSSLWTAGSTLGLCRSWRRICSCEPQSTCIPPKPSICWVWRSGGPTSCQGADRQMSRGCTWCVEGNLVLVWESGSESVCQLLSDPVPLHSEMTENAGRSTHWQSPSFKKVFLRGVGPTVVMPMVS